MTQLLLVSTCFQSRKNEIFRDANISMKAIYGDKPFPIVVHLFQVMFVAHTLPVVAMDGPFLGETDRPIKL